MIKPTYENNFQCQPGFYEKDGVLLLVYPDNTCEIYDNFGHPATGYVEQWSKCVVHTAWMIEGANYLEPLI